MKTIFSSQIKGVSMMPLIRPNSQIEILPIKRVLIPGDIVVFWLNSYLVAHRIILIEKKSKKYLYQTKGDNCKYRDSSIRQNDLIGLVGQAKYKDKIIDLSGKPFMITRFIMKYLNEYNIIYLFNNITSVIKKYIKKTIFVCRLLNKHSV